MAALAARNSPRQSMPHFINPFTASWASRRARWGSLEWPLNRRQPLLSSQFPACGFGFMAAWEAGRVDGTTPVSNWAGRGLGRGLGSRKRFRQPALEGT